MIRGDCKPFSLPFGVLVPAFEAGLLGAGDTTPPAKFGEKLTLRSSSSMVTFSLPPPPSVPFSSSSSFRSALTLCCGSAVAPPEIKKNHVYMLKWVWFFENVTNLRPAWQLGSRTSGTLIPTADRRCRRSGAMSLIVTGCSRSRSCSGLEFWAWPLTVAAAAYLPRRTAVWCEILSVCIDTLWLWRWYYSPSIVKARNRLAPIYLKIFTVIIQTLFVKFTENSK